MRLTVISVAALALAAAGQAATPAPSVDFQLLGGLKARAIGPAGMSGRVAAIDAVPGDPATVYVGAATGGLWKSGDGGLTWEPVFDGEKVAAVGAVAVFQASPDTVWVGTGESSVRNSVSVGYGVYRSRDAGHTWQHLGLAETERISRIVLHPGDANVAYVGAMGRLWGENPERGVYRTTDGGTTWKQVLYVDERTGCADLVMDPSNPDKLFAAMWDYRRWPWSFRSGGPGSGLWVTYDGGNTWKRLTESDGLPAGELGRIGIAVAPSEPAVVYALVEAKKSALVRSTDGGRTWKKVNQEVNVASRPFYYADIRVDPERPNRVYKLETVVQVSEDGGRSFRTLVPYRAVHPDNHAMWIDPHDAEHLLIGNDGGVAASRDRGATWRFVGNLPLAQYYHINVDMDTPYHVYGGLQDNGSWRGPSTVWTSGGIRNADWQEIGFGDGFDVIPDPADSMQGYSMSQQGYLRRWNLRTGERKDIRPPGPEGVELRFNWNAALAIDPFDPATIYYGSQFVHRSSDRGDSWAVISPDLTTNTPEWQKQAESGGLTLDVTGAENFTTIVAIAPSTVQRGVIWVGTDDGRIHVTRDGGATWTNVEGNVRGVPANTWVPHIRPSRFEAGTAYVVLDNHRRSDWTPYVYRTSDFGKTWRSLATPELWGYCLSLEQDPVDENLLFLGTEFGLWMSLDGGSSWHRFSNGLPTVAVSDLAVHPRDGDLVIATHGRGVFVIDDIAPLRTLSPTVQGEKLHLFPIAPAQQYRVGQPTGERFPGDGAFEGETRPYGALVTLSLNDPGLPLPDAKGESRGGETSPPATGAEPGQDDGTPQRKEKPQVSVTVKDESGTALRTFKEDAKRGVNRVVWDLRRDAFKRPRQDDDERGERERGGAEILPGTYTVTVAYGGAEASAPVTVLADPRQQVSAADRRANYEAILRAGALQEVVADAARRLAALRADVGTVLRKARGEEDEEDAGGARKELVSAAKELQKAIDDVEAKLWQRERTKGITRRDDALSKIRYVAGSLASSWDAPTPSQTAYLREAEIALENALKAYDVLVNERLPAFRSQVQEAGITLLASPPPLAVPAASSPAP